MSETYRIKPLPWLSAGDKHYAEANSLFGWYFVRLCDGEWKWWGGGDARWKSCDSIEGGKVKAEAHYRERLMAALEPVDAILVGETVVRPVFPISDG